MTLIFPNRSRSFDEVRRVVRFTGHDGMFEVRFFLEAAAITKGEKLGASETECLDAFDAARISIQEAAAKIYKQRRGNSHTLTADDLR